MGYTLGTASKATGKAKSTILRAIKNGTISANKGHDGSYTIDPSELHRVFPSNTTQQVVKNDTQPQTNTDETALLKLEILEAERARERDQLLATIDDLRARLDRSEDRITALLAAPQKTKRWKFW